MERSPRIFKLKDRNVENDFQFHVGRINNASKRVHFKIENCGNQVNNEMMILKSPLYIELLLFF